MQPQHIGPRRTERGRSIRRIGIAEGYSARTGHLAPGVGNRPGRTGFAIITTRPVQTGRARQGNHLVRTGIHRRSLVIRTARTNLEDVHEAASSCLSVLFMDIEIAVFLITGDGHILNLH